MAKSLDDLQKQVQRELGLSGSDLSDSLIRSQVDNIVNLRAKRLGLLDPKPATPADDLEEPNGTVGDWLLEASKGFMSATQLFPNTAQFLGNLASDSFDETAVGRGVRGASDFLERGSEAAADLQSEGFREKTSAPIYDDATGEWHMPNATQVVSTVLTALPQIPAYMVGAGGVNALASGARLAPRAYKLAKLAGVGSAAARGIAKFAPNAVSYGAAGGVLGGGDTFNESRGDVLATLEKMNSDLPADERERLASKLATEAAVRQLPIAALMNAVGLGGAASATGSIWKRIATGAAEEIPAEAIEEASQGVNVNLSTQKVDPTRDMWAGVRTRAALGAIAGGVMGGGVAGLESVAEKQRSARETLRRELDVNPQDIISGAHRPGGLPPDTGAPAAGLMAPVTNMPPAAEQQRTLTGEVLERPAALGANLPQLPGRTIDAPPPALRGPELTGPSSGPQPNGARQALPSIAPPKQGRTPEQRQAWREASVAAALAADSSERLDNEIPGWKEMDDGGKAAIINAVVDADGNAQTEQGKLVQQWAEHQAAGIAAVQKAAAADGGTENIDFRAERQRALGEKAKSADQKEASFGEGDAATKITATRNGDGTYSVRSEHLMVTQGREQLLPRGLESNSVPAASADEAIEKFKTDRIAELQKQAAENKRKAEKAREKRPELVADFERSATLAQAQLDALTGKTPATADKGVLSKQDALKQSLKARQNEPTEAQKAAGNYAKEHVRMHGLDIAIENPRGSTRSGTDENGKTWSNEIAHDYGYIKRTEGNDGDHVDVFIGPNLTSDKVFVVNQTHKDGSFDEHKVMLGFSSEKAATDGYLANYDAGWDRFTGVVPMSIEQFKTWLKDGDQTKPAAAPAAADERVIQNRDRGRAASVAQMQGIAKAPDYGRLGPSRSPESGAPMVFVKGDVESARPAITGKSDFVTMGDGRRIKVTYAVLEVSQVQASNSADGTRNARFYDAKDGDIVALNNGRIAGLQAAYAGGKASGYRDELLADSDGHGVPASAIGKIKNPILVRLYADADNTADIGDQSNAKQGLELSPTEKAQNDARLLNHLDDLSVDDDGFSAAGNRALIARFLRELPAEEAAGMQQADGSPSKQLLDRLQAAIFQMAYRNPDLTALMAEATDPEINNILKALLIAAPRFARLGEDVPVAIPAMIAGAAQTVRQARAAKLKVPEYLGQADMFGRDTSSDPLAHFMGENNRSVKRMGEAFGKLAEYLEDEARAATSSDMFGDARDPASLASAINYANRYLKEAYGNESGFQQRQGADLFGANPPKLGEQQAAGRLDGGLPDAGRERPENQRAEAEGAAGRDAEVTSILDAADVRGKERLEAVAKVRSGEYTIDDLRGAYPSKKAAAKEPAATNPAEPIGDFGEKIGGARKDVWSSFKDKMQAAEGLDIAAEPLSKTWPVPDYQALLDGGADPWSVAFMHAVRDEIPAKPKKGWKLKSWVAQVEMLRDLGTKAIDGRVNAETVRTKLAEAAKTSRGLTDVAGRAELYQLVGHEKSLAGVRISSGEYSLFNGVEYKPPKIIWSVEKDAKATAFSNWPRQLANGDTRAEAIANFKAKYSELEISPPAAKGTTFEIYSKRGEEGYWVGKKVGRNPILLKGGFASAKEARAYKDANNDELVKLLEKHKEIPRERRDVNNPRVGEDMRQGKDVTPAMFAEAFGFRGVEFGNWVDQKKRQKDLNDAYDALMDMAAVIGVNPRALSLNGELGLAFGARGKGGVNAAAAHFERDFFAINLTKNEGAGSLGHEWWHALDNYFSRMRSKPVDMMTDSLDVSLAARGSKFVHQGAVRKEMIEAYGAVLKAINDTNLRKRSSVLDGRRSKEYWTTPVEMSARTYESYLIAKLQDQGAANDYLANIVDEETWRAAEKLGFELENSYPYPLADESPTIRAAFDKFFQTIESREEGDNVVLFKRAGNTGTEAFRRWFGDSKVVDADGKPLAVYHGTDAAFSEFADPGTMDYRRHPSAILGNFFSRSPAAANDFVNDNGNGANIIPVYLSLQNPYEMSWAEFRRRFAPESSRYAESGDDVWDRIEEDAADFRTKLESEGYDGIIVKPSKTTLDREGKAGSLIAFRPEQIKSVYNGGTFDKDNADILMRRSDESGDIDVNRQGKVASGMKADKVRSIAADLMKGWRNRPSIIVVQSELELAGLGVDGEIIRNKIVNDGAAGEVRGVFFRGKVYLIASNIPSAEDVAITVAHEVVGHHGLRELLGADKHAALMDSIFMAYGKSALIRALPDYDFGNADWSDVAVRRQAADELVAHIAELRKKPSVVKMIVARVREWIRTYFPGIADKINLRLNDDDIIALVARAAENLKKPSAAVIERQRGIGPEAAYSQRNGKASPWYYSAVESAVADIRQEKATPEQWKAMIAKTPGVKREEIEWTGLNEWLDQKSGAVSKAEILEFVKAGGVQIEEVLKTTDAEDELPGDWDVRESEEEPGMWEVVDSDGEVVAEGNTRADAIENARDNDYSGQAQDDTKYGAYQLKGGTNYKELLLTLPAKNETADGFYVVDDIGSNVGSYPDRQSAERHAQRIGGTVSNLRMANSFKSSHWDEKNVLAHIRFNERTDAAGNRVLHIEEVQSDWHQAGRNQGYGINKQKAVVERAEDGAGWVVRGEGGSAVLQTMSQERAHQYADELNFTGGAKQGVPNAPFKDTGAWSMLAMKRMIRYAVDNGFDAVTWTGGQAQADRYDLSKQIDELLYAKSSDGKSVTIVAKKYGDNVLNKNNVPVDDLPNLVGKEVAQKIVDGDGDTDSLSGYKVLSGVDLKVGGSGMIGFYDKILPSETNKLLKKFGGKVEKIELGGTGEYQSQYVIDAADIGMDKDAEQDVVIRNASTLDGVAEFNSIREAEAWLDENDSPLMAQGFRITDQLRDAATTGLPLFQQKEDADSPYRDAVVGLTVLAREDDLFKVPRSSSKELAGIFADIDSKIRVEVSEAEAKRARQETGKPVDKAWFVYMPRQVQGRTTFDEVAVYQAGREIWINASHLKEGMSGGSRLYAAVGNYAFNNGRVFIGDPMGLSDIALLRRTEHMLSLALKFGTTRFLAPHQKQIAPASDSQSNLRGKVQGMDWRPGDDGYNLTQLVKRSYLNTIKFLPEVGHVQFDTSTLRFVDGDGNPLADGDWDAFQRLYLRRLDDALHAERAETDRRGVSAVQGGRGSAAGGSESRGATLKRAALVSALLREESRSGRRQVLVALGGELSRRGLSTAEGQTLRGTDLKEVFYKRVRDADPASGAQFTIPEESMVDTFVRKVQDKFFPVKKAQRAIEESAGAQLPDYLNVYQHEEASHGRIETAMREFENAHVKPLVAAMSEAKVDRETLDSFLYAMHAGERNAHIAEINPSMPDGGSGMTNDQAEEILDGFRKSGDFDKLAALAKRVYAMNAARLKVIRDSGLESAETIAEWSQYKYYVPLKGNASASGWARGVAQGFSVKGKESKQALGRRSIAESPLLHSIAQAEQTLMRAEKNRVAQSFLRLVQEHPNPDLWEVVTAKSDSVRRYNKQTREVEIAPNIQLRNDPDIFVLKVDGQETYIRVHDERLLTAMKNLGPEPLNALTKALGWVNRKLAAVNTSLNPEFVISNFVRDLQTAAANLETEVGRQDGRLQKRITSQVLADIPKAVRGIYHALRETDGKQDDEWVRHFNEFRADGGQIGFFGLTDYETKAAELQAMLDEAGGDWKALGKKGVRALWEFISNANGSIENATRLAAYVNARRSGVSRAKAASLAKNLTVNFNRKGELGALVNSLYLFSNASIQGTAQLVRVVGSKKGAYLATAIAGSAVLLAELNRAMAGDDDDERNFYDKVPDHVRERNLIVMKWWRDDGAYMTFPLPYGYNVFVVAGNTISDLVHGRKVSEAAVGMAGTMVGAFSPLGSEGSSNASTFLAKLASPTILDPVVQLAVNENFAGQPVFNEGFPLSAPRPDSSLYWKTTSAQAKWLAESLNALTGGSQYRSGWADVSPDSIEHLFSFVTGGAGGFVMRVGNAAERLATGDEMPVNVVPFYRKLNAEPNERMDVGLYYDRRDGLRQIKDEWEAVRKDGPEAVATFREEHGQELKMLPAMKVAEKKLKALRDQRKRIEQGKVPEEMKRPRLKAVDAQIKKAVDDFNRQYGRTVGN